MEWGFINAINNQIYFFLKVTSKIHSPQHSSFAKALRFQKCKYKNLLRERPLKAHFCYFCGYTREFIQISNPCSYLNLKQIPPTISRSQEEICMVNPASFNLSISFQKGCMTSTKAWSAGRGGRDRYTESMCRNPNCFRVKSIASLMQSTRSVCVSQRKTGVYQHFERFFKYDFAMTKESFLWLKGCFVKQYNKVHSLLYDFFYQNIENLEQTKNNFSLRINGKVRFWRHWASPFIYL